MSFLRGTEEYYQKFIELQEKLRKSEEERLRLEMKFNEMVQVSREEEQVYYRKLRAQYKLFLEEDRRRQERNERILRILERIESRAAMLAAKTERFEMLRKQYHAYLRRVFADLKQQNVQDAPQSVPRMPTIVERQKFVAQPTSNLYEKFRQTPFADDDKKEVARSPKVDIVKQYLSSLSSPTCKEEVLKATRSSEQLPLSAMSDFYDGKGGARSYDDNEFDFHKYRSNTSEIADQIIHSIHSRPRPLTPSMYTNENWKREANPAQDFDNFCGTNLYPKITGMKKPYDVDIFDPSAAGDRYNLKKPFAYDTKIDSFHLDDGVRVDLLDKYDNDKIISDNYQTEKNCGNVVGSEKKVKIPAIVRFLDESHDSPKRNLLGEEAKMQSTSLPDKLPKQFSRQNYMLQAQTDKVDSYNSEIGDGEQVIKKKELITNTGNIGVDDRKYLPDDAISSLIEVAKSSPLYNEEIKSLRNIGGEDELIEEIARVKEEVQAGDDHQLDYSGISQLHPEETDIKETQQCDQIKQKIDRTQPEFENVIEGVQPTEMIEEIQKQIQSPSEIVDSQEREGEQLQNNRIESESPIEQITTDYSESNIIRETHQNSGDMNVGQSLISEESKVDMHQNPVHYDVYALSATTKSDSIAQPIEHGGESDNLVYIQRDDVNTPAAITEPNLDKQPIVHGEETENTAYDQHETYDQQQYGNYNGNGNVDYDENRQPLHPEQMQYDEQEQPVQYDEQGLPVNYDEHDQQIQYDEHGQPIHYDQHGQQIQYDDQGQPMHYNEHGQLIQYNERGQPIQYDEQGQMISYDEQGQPLQYVGEDQYYPEQFDEHGQPLYQYDANNEYYQGDQQYEEHKHDLQHYTDRSEPEESSPRGEGDDVQIQGPPISEAQRESGNEEKTTEPTPVPSPQRTPEQKLNVMDILDTDTESIRQEAKVSNDSDFDFSNS